MASSVAMSGNDTIQINNRVLANLAEGNVVELTFPNDIATVKTGKNGNSVYGLNESGRQAEVKIRVLRGSDDDKFLNNLNLLQQNNFAGTVLMNGQFIKKIGDGLGNIGSDNYIMSGGVFTKFVEAKSNVEGESEHSVSMFTINFSSAIRVLT
jgi:hypothetical protein